MSEMGQERTANVVLTADVDPYRQSIQQAGTDTQRLTDRVDKLTRSLNELSKTAGKKMTLFGAGTVAGVTATTASFVAFDKQMTSLRVNAEVTGRSYDKMTKSVNDMRREFGASTSTVAELQRQIYGFKDNTAPVEKLTETFIKLGAATGEAPTTMAQGLLQLQRSMGTTQRDTDRYANVLTDLSVKSGVAASSILNFSQAIAPIGRVAGMQQAEIMGIATAFNKAGADGYMAANAFNKMLSDIMYSVQTGSPDLAKYANLIGLTSDQFKSMVKEGGATGALTSMFDELNRLGPNAIEIMNRMGLDGMRMQRSLQAVSQQTGGIGSAVAQAVSAYNDSSQSSLNRGSDAALDTVSNKMQDLAESTKQMSEAMGSSFEGPAKVFLTTMEKIVNVMGDLARSPLGQFTGWLVGMAGPLAIVTGLLMKFAGGIGALATGRALVNNFGTQGFSQSYRERQALARGQLLPVMPNASTRAMGRGDTNWVNRLMYGGGQWLGERMPVSAVGYRSMLAGGLMRGVAFGADMYRASLGPLFHPFNPSARPRFWATTNERLAGAGSGPGGVFSRSFFGGAQAGHTFASRAIDWSQRALTTPLQRYIAGDGVRDPNWRPPILGGAGPNAANLLRATGGALGAVAGGTVGLGMIGGRFAGNMAMGAVRGLGSLGMNIGPLGAAMLGFGLSSWHKQANSLEGVVGRGSGNETTFMDTYNAAVGKATTSVQDFARALDAAAGVVGGRKVETTEEAMKVTAKDIAYANAKKDYENPDLANLTEDQAKQLVASQLGRIQDPQALQVLKTDLIKAFSGQGAERILGYARENRGQFDMNAYMKDIVGTSGFDWKLGLGKDERAETAYRVLETELKAQSQAAYEVGGNKAATRVQRANLNQLVGAWGQTWGDGTFADVTKGDTSRFENFLNRVFLDGKGQFGSLPWKDMNMGDVLDAGRNHGSVGAIDEFWRQALNAEGQTKEMVDRVLLPTIGLSRKEAERQMDGGVIDPKKGSLWDTTGGDIDSISKAVQTGFEKYESRILKTKAGQILNGVVPFQEALEPGNTANQNVRIKGVDAAVQALLDAAKEDGFRGPGSMSQRYAYVDAQLLAYQGTVQDPSDPRYTMAADARAQLSRQLSYAMPYMGMADQFSVVADSYIARSRELAPTEGKSITPDAANELKTATDEMEKYKANIQSQLESMLIQQREFDIQKRRSDYDFYTIQLPRMEEEFSISRTRANDDYNLSRQRAEQDFAISRARSERQFNISRRDSIFDYNLSRKRAEEDFAHQQVLMAKQAAAQMYNIYERTMVQRTWSGSGMLQNSQDQLRRMREQNKDLKALRELGMSNDAIQMFGLADPNNAQQLDRLLKDAEVNPNLIQGYNQNAKRRIKEAGKLVKDESNPQWAEMERQFELSMSRAEEDFQRGMRRNSRNFRIAMRDAAADFGRSMDRMAADFDKTMDRAEADYERSLENMEEDYERMQKRALNDLKRFQKEITWGFEETLEKANDKFGGYLGKVVDKMISKYKELDREIKRINRELRESIENGWKTGHAVGQENNANVPQAVSGSSGGGGGGGGTGGGSGGGGGGLITPLPEGSYNTGYNEYGTPNSRYAKGYHTGDDYSAPAGTPILAAMDGRVSAAGYAGAYGNLVILDHGGGIQTYYAHQSNIGVSVGDRVNAGDRIGAVGTTGNSDGNHLHFEVRVNGQDVDPDTLGTFKAIASMGGFDLDRVLKDRYPKLERKVERGVTKGLWEKNFLSSQINAAATDWYAQGSIFAGPKVIGVGEAGPEAVLPLNERGADFLASVMQRFAGEAKGVHTRVNPMPVTNATYNYRIDKSTQFTGPVHVHGVENPKQLAEKARLEARRKKLTTGGER